VDSITQGNAGSKNKSSDKQAIIIIKEKKVKIYISVALFTKIHKISRKFFPS